MMKKSSLILAMAIAIALPVLPARSAGSATLFISPSSGTYTVGKAFTVSVMVNAAGGAINAAEGSLKYDPAFLSVTKVSDTGSIFELWTTKPTYNAAGTISFGGGLPASYSGKAGTIFTITFNPKKVGSTSLNFTAGVILAADGKGTNVFGGFGNANFTIEEAKKAEPVPTPTPEVPKEEGVKGILPPLPEVNSPTHPDQNTWYQSNDPEFIWKLLQDITGVSFDLNSEKELDPVAKTTGIIESKRLEDIADGEWYFHVRYQNKVGWGKSAHRRVLIDSTAPRLDAISIDNEGDPTNPAPRLEWRLEEKTSGIERYSLLLDQQSIEVKPEEAVGNIYHLSAVVPGEHTLAFAAYDRAGNAATSTLKFTVEALRPPLISDIPKLVTTRDEIMVRGTTFYKQVDVMLYFQKDGAEPIEYSVKTDDQGGWNYFHKRTLDKGTYEVWAKVVDARGAQSLSSARYVITVVKPSIIADYGWLIILILLAIIVLLILYIIYLKRRHHEEWQRTKREIGEAKLRLNEIFAALREEVDELMEMADKRPGLSESERRVKDKFREALNISQEFLDKELEDAEKEIDLNESDSK